MNENQPAYEIRLQGHLDPRRFQQIELLTITHLPNGETLLILPGLDQAKLFGALIRIRDMGVPLLSVTRNHLKKNGKRTSMDKDG